MPRIAFLLALLVPLPLLAASPDWPAILKPAKVQLPPPQDDVVWRPDLAKALQEAKQTHRPLFVTLRCLPCKQCSAFDKDVLEGGPVLEPLLKQFITVRLTSAKDVDLRILPMAGHQDMDLSWWGYILSPTGQLYAIFGGRDEVSDETRISVPALANVLQRVLDHHYNPARASWHIDPPAPDLDQPLFTPTMLPGYPSWRSRSGPEVKAQACIHCHQVAEILRQPAIDAGTFDKHRDTEIWPLPENIGLVLDRDHGLLVKKVLAGSPAASAGLKAGDILAAANDTRLFGQADLRGILHRLGQGDHDLALVYHRSGAVASATLHLSGDWRKTVLDWRMSISQGNFGAYPGFWPLPASNNERKKVGAGSASMAVKPFLGPKPTITTKAGLKGSDIITAVDGQSPNLSGRAFLVWFNMRHSVGDEVRITVQGSSTEKRELVYTLLPRGQEN